ncbi:hypothetical protein EDD21DRAFT_405637 [Dissophora ornata]|nr:hypothetical protein EDD21DRAFT_405637 [Dissophora ornata]
MLPMGQYKAIAILLALCLFASFFYFEVWSTINPNSDQRAAAVLQKQGWEPNTIFHHHHQQKHADSNVLPITTAAAEQPSPLQTSDLKVVDAVNTIDPSSSLPVSSQPPLSPKSKQHKTEKQRLKALKKLRKSERLERERKKEEKKQRKIAKLQRLEHLNAEPFPALISTNNARVAGLNLRAFERFCQDQSHDLSSKVKKQTQRQEEEAEPSTNKEDAEGVMDRDFETYEEWMEYIRNKNLGQEQQTLPPSTVSHTPQQQGQRPKTRPLFWERPLRDWIVNYTAILEPCDRKKHTSAHCLSYLSQDHLYLVPSHEARLYPNRVHSIIAPDGKVQPEDIDLETSTGQENLSTTAMMHFHIFWRGVITDKLSLAAHAFLFTQPLDRARLHLWIDSTGLPRGDPEDYTLNPFAKDLVSAPVNRFVKLHAWNQKAQKAYADGAERLDKAARIRPVALSDEARFLILYHYGGMYLDADVLLLRDMAPLYDVGMEFAYEWSDEEMYNTAVLRLNRRSNVARRVMDGAKVKEKEIQENQTEKKEQDGGKGQAALKMPQNARKAKKRTRGKPKQPQPQPEQEEQRPANVGSVAASISPAMVTEDHGKADNSPGNGDSESLSTSGSSSASIASPHLIKRREVRPSEIYHPARLRKYLDPDNNAIANNGLTMMPTMIFDPLWLRVDRAESADGLKTDKEEMMKNLMTFPDAFTNPGAPIDPQSWMGLMRQAYDEFLAGERPNLYGEWFRGDSEMTFRK